MISFCRYSDIHSVVRAAPARLERVVDAALDLGFLASAHAPPPSLLLLCCFARPKDGRRLGGPPR
eukprot:846377-Prymnesium_polylepis.1